MIEVSIFESFFSLGLLLTKIFAEYFSHLVINYFSWSSDLKIQEQSCREKVINAKDISEIAAAHGYLVREHVVKTRDNYLLVLHKLEKKGLHFSTGSDKVVYFHHGLLTNSELFLLGDKRDKILPFLMLEEGYEVWLGNNRGNKYSKKHLTLSTEDPRFWNFSLDEYAMFDIPDTINHILSFYSPETKLTYVGFSQGCSQLFASLSLNPSLNSKINLFIGLSPAVVPKDLNHRILKLIVKQTAENNRFLYSFFGTRAILPSVSFWSHIMGPSLYEKIVDKSLIFLFGWKGNNISKSQKTMGYPHMFSNTSVKSLIHWFQIIHAKRFQMFEETSSCGRTGISNYTSGSRTKANKVAPFPIAHHLNVPMLLFYGDSDILVDIDETKKLIFENNFKLRAKLIDIINCPGYEHMDTLWGDNVYEDVFKLSLQVVENLHIDGATLTNSSSESLCTPKAK